MWQTPIAREGLQAVAQLFHQLLIEASIIHSGWVELSRVARGSIIPCKLQVNWRVKISKII